MKTTLTTTLFSIAISFLTNASHASEPFFQLRLLGDVNGDQRVTLQDAALLIE